MKNILKKSKKGFTIIELVIVIGVIAILSAIMIPTFVNLTDRANKAALQSELSATYSMYASDASDGKYGDPDAPGAKDLILYQQDEITILKGETYYVRDNEGKWEEKASSEFTYGVESPIDSETNYVVGNYSVFHIKQSA